MSWKLIMRTVFVPREASRDLYEAQRFALEMSGVDSLPRNSAFQQLRMACDAADWLPTCLQRDSAEELGGSRHLPFLSEIIDFPPNRPAAAEWIGFINSDIILTHYFPQDFELASRGRDMLLVRVSDIPSRLKSHVHKERRWKPRPNPESVDGIIVRIGAGLEIPDLVIGEPFWDNYVVEWVKRMGDRAETLPCRDALHPAHNEPRRWCEGLEMRGNYEDWQGLEPGGEHNRRLFLELQRS